MSSLLPIFVFEQVDLNVFADAQAACNYIEPPDVAVLEVFDASGASVLLRIDGASPGWFGRRGQVAEDGRVAGSEHRDRFRELLAQHVLAVGVAEYALDGCDLESIPLQGFALRVASRRGFTQ